MYSAQCLTGPVTLTSTADSSFDPTLASGLPYASRVEYRCADGRGFEPATAADQPMEKLEFECGPTGWNLPTALPNYICAWKIICSPVTK